jgi:hypothetical protein
VPSHPTPDCLLSEKPFHVSADGGPFRRTGALRIRATRIRDIAVTARHIVGGIIGWHDAKRRMTPHITNESMATRLLLSLAMVLPAIAQDCLAEYPTRVGDYDYYDLAFPNVVTAPKKHSTGKQPCHVAGLVRDGGLTVSVTSAKAPNAARKAYEKGSYALCNGKWA